MEGQGIITMAFEKQKLHLVATEVELHLCKQQDGNLAYSRKRT